VKSLVNLESVTSDADAIDIVIQILRSLPHDSITTLAELKVSPANENRLRHLESIQPLVTEALKLRAEYKVPFWMATMFVAQKRNLQIPEELYAAASFHLPMSSVQTFEIPVRSLDRQSLRDRTINLKPGTILTISSKIKSGDGSIMHIPMLDFRIASSDASLPSAKAAIRQLGLDGWILNSGQSYHFYGARMLSVEEFHQFLYKALFFTPIIDYRWIAHQLIEDAAALRISAGSDVQTTPSLVSTVQSFTNVQNLHIDT
jgi:hypothetical protein